MRSRWITGHAYQPVTHLSRAHAVEGVQADGADVATVIQAAGNGQRRDRLRGTPPELIVRRQVSWLADRRPSPPSRAGKRSQWHVARGSRLQLRGQLRIAGRTGLTAFPFHPQDEGPSIGSSDRRALEAELNEQARQGLSVERLLTDRKTDDPCFPALTLVLGARAPARAATRRRSSPRLPPPWTYIATAQAFDDEMRERIALHRGRREAVAGSRSKRRSNSPASHRQRRAGTRRQCWWTA